MENSPYRKKCTKKAWILVLSGFFVCLNVSSSDARRIHLSPEQQAQLANANSVFVKVLALTEKGPADSSPFIETITTRLQELNYTVVTDATQPHDIEFKVKCEERKTLTGTSATGGDVELADAPDRLWKGPACLLTYQLDHRDLEWKKEIRTSFSDAAQAAQQAEVANAGDYADFNSFFTRALKPGARSFPQDVHAIASPVDGRVSQIGNITVVQLVQAICLL